MERYDPKSGFNPDVVVGVNREDRDADGPDRLSLIEPSDTAPFGEPDPMSWLWIVGAFTLAVAVAAGSWFLFIVFVIAPIIRWANG